MRKETKEAEPFKKVLRKAEKEDKKSRIKALVKSGMEKNKAREIVDTTTKEAMGTITYEDVVRQFLEVEAAIRLGTPAVNEFVNAGIQEKLKDDEDKFNSLAEGIKLNLEELESTLTENQSILEDFKIKKGPVADDDIISMYNITSRAAAASTVLGTIHAIMFIELAPMCNLNVFETKGGLSA